MEENFEKIKDQFKKVIMYSQDSVGTDVQVDELFDRWFHAKSKFMNYFGGQCIYEYPETVTFELSEKDKNRKVMDFVERIDSVYRNEDLAEFIETHVDDFYRNRLTINYTTKAGVSIPKGIKFVKAFKFFNLGDWLDKIQTEASQIIQEDKISGKLCVSVHPLDYLSSSENAHNWRSCHALDGDYRAGNASYMTDSSTVICYLKSEHDQNIPNFPFAWNSKKWRVLMFFSEDEKMLFAGRQYPFSTTTGIDFLKEEVFPRANLGQWGPWSRQKITEVVDENGEYFSLNHKYVPVGGELVAMHDLITDRSSLHFDDLLESSCYDPYYSVRVRETFNNWKMRAICDHHTHFFIGGEVSCMRCGKKHIQVSSTFLCNDCEIEWGDCDDDTFAYCPNCGRRFVADDGYYVQDAEELVCPDCGQSEVLECGCCGNTAYEVDMIYDDDTQQLLCRSCAASKDEF